MTSAPKSASSIPQNGPARTRERSITRMPLSGRSGVMSLRVAEDKGLTPPAAVDYHEKDALSARRRDLANPRSRWRHGDHDPGPRPASLRFRGPALEGCNEHLNLTRPDVIRDIHAAYLDA